MWNETNGKAKFVQMCVKIILVIFKYRISGIFRVGKFWRKWHLEGVLNFHWVIFSLFQGLSMKTYSRVYFSLCLFFAISRRLRTQRKLNPREKFAIYGITQLILYTGTVTFVQSSNSGFQNIFYYSNKKEKFRERELRPVEIKFQFCQKPVFLNYTVF